MKRFHLRAVAWTWIILTFLAWEQAGANQCRQVFSPPPVAAQAVGSYQEFTVLMGSLKNYGEFERLYSSYNEAAKKITIETHTQDVFKQFLKESHYRTLNKEFLRILPVTIALHDIGKPLAIVAGQRDAQHLYTVPLLEGFLRDNGWSPLDIKRSVALVTYTGFGELVKGEKSALVVMSEITHLSRDLRVEPWDFYVAKRAFYLADAGAYSQLRGTVFVPATNGRLQTKGTQLEELEAWMSGGRY